MDLNDELKKAVDQYWEAADAEKSIKEQKDELRQQLLDKLPDLTSLPGETQLKGFKHALKIRRDSRFKLDQKACNDSAALNEAIDQGRLPEVARYFKLQMSRETFAKICEVLKQNGLLDPILKVELEYVLSEKPDVIRKRAFDMQQRLGADKPLSEFLEDVGSPRFYLER